MVLTGLGFAGLTTFWPLLIVAVAGTLNPSAGDVSVFLPTEQAALAHTVAGPARTTAFAWYNLAGSLAGAVGALASGVPAWLAARRGVSLLRAERGVFVFYAALRRAGGASSTRALSPAVEVHPRQARARAPLADRGASCCGWRRCSASIRSAAASSCSRCWCCGCYRRFDLTRARPPACSSPPAR